jgi:YbbR domain-containing protein
MMKTLFERYVIKDWKLKLLSLGLAVMLWYTVFQIGEPKKDITVPLSVAHLPRSMVITKMDPERVFVTVSGRVSMLKDIKDRDVTAVISLNGSKEGETVFEISKSNVSVPKGIDIVDVKPGTVRVVVDRIIEKKLKVVPVLDKKWTGRYDVILASPQHVFAEGPRKVLEGATTVETLPANGDFRHVDETVNVGFNTEDLPHVKIRSDSARIVLRRHPGKETHWD